jgi:DNA repair ATPase RecN
MSETKRANWRCYSCKGANRQESVTDEETSMEQHFAEIKKDIEKSKNFLSEKYDELLRKLEDNNEIIASMKNTIETLVGTVKEKEVIIDNLSARVNHLEKYSRNHNFEISQVQEDDHENLEEIVLTLADKMRIP